MSAPYRRANECQRLLAYAIISAMSTAEIIAELPRLTPEELAQVESKLKELVKPATTAPAGSVVTHPALGMWKNRTDLPTDPVEASRSLRERMMRRADDSAE